MKMVKRDVYLHEFENFNYAQRFYYIWANEIGIENPRINFNPLRWCLLDVIKLVYMCALVIVIFPVLIVPGSFYMAHRLKFKYKDEEDKTWYKSNQKIME